MINGNYIGNKTTNESGLPYVIDMNGNIIVGKRSGNGRGPGALPTPHPTLIGGNDPQVQMAGLLKIGGEKYLAMIIIAVTINRMQNQCLSLMKHSQNCHLHYFQKNSKGEISNYAKLKIKNRILI